MSAEAANEHTVPVAAPKALRTYTVSHRAEPEKLEPLLQAYRDTVNWTLGEPWGHKVLEKGEEPCTEAPA